MKPVVLLDYQASWPLQFSRAAAELASAFGADPVGIEHIGSTAVPGLCAKPVLDIMLGVPALVAITCRTRDLEALGYRYRPAYEAELPERRYFVRPEGGLARIHLHGLVQGGSLWLKHLAFRDALRHGPELSQAYAALKTRLAAQHCDDKAAYTQAKAPFIEGVLAGAGMSPQAMRPAS